METHPIANDIKTSVKNKGIWIRLLYMLLFAFLYYVTEFVIFAVVIYQFLHILLTGGKKDENVINLGMQLSSYVYQILQFQTFNSETKPFPMSDWPSDKHLLEEDKKPKRAPRPRKTDNEPTDETPKTE